MTRTLTASFLITVIAALTVASAAKAGVPQEPGAGRGGPVIASPEVASDRRVTFRLRAPDAKAVTVSGDFGSDAAMKKGLWKSTYAAENAREYFAEGVQAWFDANLEANPPDGIHNHVNTRKELLQYDPDLAALIGKVFP